MSDIKAPVLELSAKIKSQLKAEAGVISSPKDLFEATLPEGVTLDTVKAVDQAKTTFVAAYTNAVGETAHALMAGDKTLETVTAKADVNKDVLSVAVLRTETRPDPQNPGQTKTAHGVVKPNFKAYAGRGDVGQLATVRKSVRNMFADLAD